MSMNVNMNKKVLSALMCALLCTGDISLNALNQFNSAHQMHSSAAGYHMIQTVLSSDNGYDEFDDEENEEDVLK